MPTERSIAEKIGRFMIGLSFFALGIAVVWYVSIPLFRFGIDNFTPYISILAFPVSILLASIPPVLLEPLAVWILDKSSKEKGEG